jgi:MFS family permease
MRSLRQHAGRSTRAASAFAGIAIGALVAVAVPAFWIWLASEIAGTERELTASLAVFIATGIVVSYWIALLIAGWIRGRVVDEAAERARGRRMSWNRSFREDSHPIAQTDPIEVAFVVIAVLAVIAFEIWFFFFAGSPLPNQPLF